MDPVISHRTLKFETVNGYWSKWHFFPNGQMVITVITISKEMIWSETVRKKLQTVRNGQT